MTPPHLITSWPLWRKYKHINPALDRSFSRTQYPGACDLSSQLARDHRGPFVSDVSYSATSLGTATGLAGLLTRGNLIAALTVRANAGSWPPPTLGTFRVAQPPTP